MDLRNDAPSWVRDYIGLPFKDGFNCLNCDGDHKLMRCPQLTAEKRQEIEAALRGGA